jgi:hypothetical protein
MHSSILFCVLVHEMHNVVVITRDIELTDQKLINWHSNVTRRDKGFGQLFVHKLSSTNINKSTLVSLVFLFCEHFLQ